MKEESRPDRKQHLSAHLNSHFLDKEPFFDLLTNTSGLSCGAGAQSHQG